MSVLPQCLNIINGLESAYSHLHKGSTSQAKMAHWAVIASLSLSALVFTSPTKCPMFGVFRSAGRVSPIGWLGRLSRAPGTVLFSLEPGCDSESTGPVLNQREERSPRHIKSLFVTSQTTT